MYANYFKGKKQGVMIHYMLVTPTPSIVGFTIVDAQQFKSAKEAKAYAKSLNATPWNY